MIGFVLLLKLLTSPAEANTANDAVLLRAQALQKLQTFTPGATLPHYQDHPPEAALDLQAAHQNLPELGQARAGQNETSKFILQEEGLRHKTDPQSHASQFEQAEQVLNQAEAASTTNIQDDVTQAEESDDLQEGLSRLGVLGATAEEVANLQVSSGSPRLFAGYAQECEKYMLNLRDCCTDSGFLQGLIHCPWQLQQLQRAKLENRVVYLGHFKPHRFSATRHRFCVFPTKLSSIIQIQGRLGQLGIGFGSVWYPDCRGMTPEELARLDFKRLDLSPMVQALLNKTILPDNHVLDHQAASQVDHLYQQGAAHD